MKPISSKPHSESIGNDSPSAELVWNECKWAIKNFLTSTYTSNSISNSISTVSNSNTTSHLVFGPQVFERIDAFKDWVNSEKFMDDVLSMEPIDIDIDIDPLIDGSLSPASKTVNSPPMQTLVNNKTITETIGKLSAITPIDPAPIPVSSALDLIDVKLRFTAHCSALRVHSQRARLQMDEVDRLFALIKS